MSLDYTRPDEGLARELREVARDATALREALTLNSNFNFPSDFPKKQLIDIARSLEQLPSGTAEGCRASLEYARNRLPAIRRAHVLSEEFDVSRSSDLDAPPPVLRGTHIDLRLRDLISSVTTALDEYRRQAVEELLEDTRLEVGLTAPRNLTSNAIAQSSRLESELTEALTTVHETTKPGSPQADNLKRQINDAQGLNRLARTELRMPKIVVSWCRKTVGALKHYPNLIKKTAERLKDGADIVQIVLDRWHDFKRNGTTFLVEEFKTTCDSMLIVASKLEEQKIAKTSDSKKSPQDLGIERAFDLMLREILSDAKRPMQSGEIAEEFRNRGRPVSETNEMKMAWNQMWRASKRGVVVNLPGLGYWLANAPLPPGAGEAAKEIQSLRRKNLPKGEWRKKRLEWKGRPRGRPRDPSLTLSPAKQERAKAMLIGNGKTVRQIYKELGVNQSILNRYFPGGRAALRKQYPELAAQNPPRPPRKKTGGGQGPRRSPEIFRTAELMYQRGKSVDEIAPVLGVPRTTIFRHLRKQGLVRRGTSK